MPIQQWNITATYNHSLLRLTAWKDNIHIQPFLRDSASASPHKPSGEFEYYSARKEIPCSFMEPQG
jgi:hypothetical protein